MSVRIKVGDRFYEAHSIEQAVNLLLSQNEKKEVRN